MGDIDRGSATNFQKTHLVESSIRLLEPGMELVLALRHLPCELPRYHFAFATYTVHAGYYRLTIRLRSFFVRSIRFSSVCLTVFIRHNTSLYQLIIRWLNCRIRNTSVLYVTYPFKIVPRHF